MALTDAEKKELRDEAAREKARGSESDDQKWLRQMIREELAEFMPTFFTSDDDDDKTKPGGPGKFLDGIFSRTGT
jgi:hypothetical protein